MAIVELKYNDTVIYVEDTVPEEERGYALEKNDLEEDLNKTQEFKPIKDNIDLLSDTIEMEVIGENYEWSIKYRKITIRFS